LPIAGDDLKSIFQRGRHNELGFAETGHICVIDQQDGAMAQPCRLVRIEVPVATVFPVGMRPVEIQEVDADRERA
jgi:hypothetical protein